MRTMTCGFLCVDDVKVELWYLMAGSCCAEFSLWATLFLYSRDFTGYGEILESTVHR
jgi:hypothetical protein